MFVRKRLSSSGMGLIYPIAKINIKNENVVYFQLMNLSTYTDPLLIKEANKKRNY